MSRFFRALVILSLVASCGGGGGRSSAPRGLDNACSIAKQRPEYMPAFRKAERKWGVPVHVQMAAMYHMNRSRERNGIALDDATNQYLAYHEGHTGYKRGTFYGKSWLMRVASEVGQRARTYRSQLSRCRV